MKLTIRNIENKPFSKGWLKYLNNEITRFCEKEEKTIILTAHNHRDIENLCDVVYFMDQGDSFHLQMRLEKYILQ